MLFAMFISTLDDVIFYHEEFGFPKDEEHYLIKGGSS
jgi:hypothetical protein